MRAFVRRNLSGLCALCVVALLASGCAGRSVTSSAQDLALEVPPPPPPAVEPAPTPPAVEPAPPPPEPPKVEAPAEQPVARETEQPPAAEPQAPPPPAPEPPREQAAETTVPPQPVEEAKVTEPEVAPPPPPPQVAAVEPAPPPPPPAPPALSDIFFDFDKFIIRDDAKPTLEQNASVLKGQEGWKLVIEGHCDERGTSAYNLVLGERRAQATRDYLASLGLPASQITVTSFGKEKPFCTEHSHACWQENRRAHFVTEK